MMRLEAPEFDTVLYHRPESLEDYPLHLCPGCGHGIVHRLIAEVIDELGIRERAVCVASIGCSVNSYHYFNFDGLESAHGRAPAVATAIKRCHPNLVPFTYQGDGDLAAIGTAEIVHACARGENFTTIFVNNAIYGMTGGQLAPTTLVGMYSTSTTGGRRIRYKPCIGHATSPDMVHWTEQEPALHAGTGDDWDTAPLGTGMVFPFQGRFRRGCCRCEPRRSSWM